MDGILKHKHSVNKEMNAFKEEKKKVGVIILLIYTNTLLSWYIVRFLNLLTNWSNCIHKNIFKTMDPVATATMVSL